MNREKVLGILEAFPCMTRIFGTIIEARLGASKPESFILQMLETGDRTLDWWESHACKYLAIIDNHENAISNLSGELLGEARTSHRQKFDGRLKDAMAEVCTAVELSLRGGTEFKRIVPPACEDQKVRISNVL